MLTNFQFCAYPTAALSSLPPKSGQGRVNVKAEKINNEIESLNQNEIMEEVKMTTAETKLQAVEEARQNSTLAVGSSTFLSASRYAVSALPTLNLSLIHI